MDEKSDKNVFHEHGPHRRWSHSFNKSVIYLNKETRMRYTLDGTPPLEAVRWQYNDNVLVGETEGLPLPRDVYCCGIYIRVSTDRQGKEGLGASAQRSNILKCILQQHNAVIVLKEMREERSAATGDNTQLLEFVKHLGKTKGRPNLWAFTSDRVARSNEQRGLLEQALRIQKVELCYADGIDDLMRPFSEAMGNVERATIKRRIIRAMAERKDRGQISHLEVKRKARPVKGIYKAVHKRNVKVYRYRLRFEDEVRRLRRKGDSFASISKKLRLRYDDGPSQYQVQRMMYENEEFDPNADIEKVYKKQIRKTQRIIEKTAKINEDIRYARLGEYLEKSSENAIVTKGHGRDPKIIVSDIPPEERTKAHEALARKREESLVS